MSPQEKWVSLFEQVIGRKPTPQEFLAGKQSDFDLKKIKQIAQNQVASPPSSPEPVSLAPTLTTNKKRNVWLGIAVALLLLVSGSLWTWGHHQTKLETRIDTFSSAVKSQDFQEVATLLSESGTKWTKKDAQAFVRYLDSQECGLQAVLNGINKRNIYRDKNQNKLLGLVENGKKWLVFPNYEFVTYPLEIVVTSQLEELSIDGQPIQSGDAVLVDKRPFIPGEMQVLGKTALATVETELSINPDLAKKNKLAVMIELLEQNIEAILPFDDDHIEELALFVNEQKVSDQLSATIPAFPGQVFDVKVQFSIKGKSFETKVSRLQAGDTEVALTLEEADQEQIETLLKSLIPKRQARVLWNADKSNQLANFMVDWGNSMDQPNYQDITASEVTFVQENRVRLNQVQDVTTEFSQDGTGNSDYQVVAIYRYHYSGNQVHTYYFTIRADGVPIVLYSAQNQGMDDGKFYMKETANDDLKAGFANLVHQ